MYRDSLSFEGMAKPICEMENSGSSGEDEKKQNNFASPKTRETAIDWHRCEARKEFTQKMFSVPEIEAIDGFASFYSF